MVKDAVLDQEEKDAAARRKREQLQARREELELAKLEHDVAEIETQRESRRRSHEANEEALASQIRREEELQASCSHMKGGPGETLLGGAPGFGDAAGNWALIRHTFGTGKTVVMCQRCQKEWWPGDKAYNEMLRKPTRNKASSSSLHVGLIRNPDALKQNRSRN